MLSTPVLVRSPKLSSIEPSQYLGGWPPGNTRCCKLFATFDDSFYWFFTSGSKGIKPEHQIRFQIGVGGRLFNKPMPEKFDQLNWRCPAFIIDYVRIFEKVSSDTLSLEQMPECQDISLNNSQKVIDSVCKMAMDHIEKDESFVSIGKTNWCKFFLTEFNKI